MCIDSFPDKKRPMKRRQSMPPLLADLAVARKLAESRERKEKEEKQKEAKEGKDKKDKSEKKDKKDKKK